MKKALLGVSMTFAMPCMAHSQLTAHDHSGSGPSWMIWVGLAAIACSFALWRRKGSL